MEKTLSEFLFTKEHEWVKVDNDNVIFGITEHAQQALGDIVYVELPSLGSSIEKGQSIGVVESVKAVSDLYAPVSGVVASVNPLVENDPSLINLEPYGQGWLITITPRDREELLSLLSQNAYQELLAEEEK